MSRPSDDEILAAYQLHGSIRKTAVALNMPNMTVWRAVNRASSGASEKRDPTPSGDDSIVDQVEGRGRVIASRGVTSLQDLLSVAGVNDEWICTRHKVNTWQALGKDSEKIQLHQVTAHLTRANDFWVNPITVENPIKRTVKPAQSSQGLALLVPDTQHGYRAVEDLSKPGLRDWQPLHDRAAIDCVLQVAEHLKDRITHVVFLGDHLDLAPWSTRWKTSPDLLMTTNAALRELYAGLLRPLRETLPSAEMVYVMGNHDARIEDFLAERAPEASTLMSADTVDNKPLLTIENLLALDSLDIELIAPYGRPYWLFDEIKIFHGNKAKNRGGATAAEYLKTATSSIIYGHIHRLELAQSRIETPGGHKVVTAASPGCLSRCELGVVPGRAGSPPDWQTGFGLVEKVDDWHSVNLYPILDGRCVVNGQVFHGDGGVEKIREATGIPF